MAEVSNEPKKSLRHPVDETRTAEEIAVSAIEDILRTTALGPAFSPDAVARRIPQDLRAMHYSVILVQQGRFQKILDELGELRREADKGTELAALSHRLKVLEEQIEALGR